jgi:hypothetical protein
MYFVVWRFYLSVFGSYLSSLYSYLELYRRCGLAYSYDWRGFVGAKKKTSLCLAVFNSSMIYSDYTTRVINIR